MELLVPETLSCIGIATASMLGSVHCAAMCGGFVPLCGACGKKTSISHLLYSLGRLVTYLSLGCLAATLGVSVDRLGGFAHIQRLSSLLVGVTLLLYGIGMLCRGRGLGLSLAQYPFRVSTFFGKHLLARSREGYLYPFFLGLTTTLLPCGWLYAFVALAASSGDVRHGALILFSFWMGTLPMMLGLGWFTNTFVSRIPLARLRPGLFSVIVFGAGVFSLYQHFGHTHHHQQHVHAEDDDGLRGR